MTSNYSVSEIIAFARKSKKDEIEFREELYESLITVNQAVRNMRSLIASELNAANAKVLALTRDATRLEACAAQASCTNNYLPLMVTLGMVKSDNYPLERDDNLFVIKTIK